jgi:hypothetical protein
VASVTLQAAVPVADAPANVRPSSVLPPGQATLRWSELGHLPATGASRFGSPASARKAAGTIAPRDRWASRSEAIAPPRGFGLITAGLPLVRASLGQALDRLLTRIEDLGGGQAVRSGSLPGFVPIFVVLAVAAARGAAIAVARLRRHEADFAGEAGAEGRIGRHGLPGLPSPH